VNFYLSVGQERHTGTHRLLGLKRGDELIILNKPILIFVHEVYQHLHLPSENQRKNGPRTMSTPPIYLAADEKQMDENKGKKTDKGSRTPPAPREPGCAQASDRASEPGSKEARQRASARERSRARAREGGREGGRAGGRGGGGWGGWERARETCSSEKGARPPPSDALRARKPAMKSEVLTCAGGEEEKEEEKLWCWMECRSEHT
jgi:hypothetical protein